VSGMSHVGQWESRLIAILKEARKRNHVLYFDDLPGLLQAGKSRDSSLSMGQVIRPFLERREVRVLAEITPESWRVLRERDRGLADLFDVLPVSETDTETTARIVLAERRLLEQEFRCQFALEALPAVLEIERRYSPDAAFPGKAIRFLKDLALIRRGAEVTRSHVLDEFHRRSGLDSRFLDPRVRLPRQDVVDALQSQVVGQAEPVAAVADILSIAKARLNDTDRPMGSLLFVGPTGVGKTQLAKAAAQFVFGDANRIVRIDLNEFISRGSASRLVGTFDEPDGLLTGAIRRQPFAVVLLDEIEKGHPEVFDVLLQVLGEGRLSDGLGRTVSFANTLIVMTSNLGVRENSQRLGFASDDPVGDHVWQRAVQRFFRPEFFNRIDRIVPFQRLSRDVIRQVARLTLNEMLLRDGLTRRRCVLTIEPQVLDRAIESGYSTTLGARALKRSLEQMLIQPAGRQLAAMPPKTLTRLHLYPMLNGIAVHVQALPDADPPAHCVAMAKTPSPQQVLNGLERFVVRIESAIAEYRPGGPISAGQVSEQQRTYFLLQERCRQLRDVLRRQKEIADEADQPGAQSNIPSEAFRHSRKVIARRVDTPSSFWAHLAREESAAVSFHQSLRDLFDQADLFQSSEDELLSVLHEAALADAELTTLRDQIPTRIGLCIRPLDGQHCTFAWGLAARLQRILSEPVKGDNQDLGLDCTVIRSEKDPDHQPETLLEVSGLAAVAIANLESGIHLSYADEGRFRVVQVVSIPLQPGQSLLDAWNAIQAQREQWLDRLSRGEAAIEDDPLSPGPVIRLLDGGALTLNLRTGDMTEGPPDTKPGDDFCWGHSRCRWSSNEVTKSSHRAHSPDQRVQTTCSVLPLPYLLTPIH